MQKYERLDAGNLAKQVAVDIYRLTRSFPVAERFEMVKQMRRAAVSMGSNLAEGTGRETDADFKRFVAIARGSATELHFQLALAVELGYVPLDLAQPTLELIDRVSATLTGLMRKLQ